MDHPVSRKYIRIDVLPLAVLTDDQRVEILCEGLVMDLISDLSRFRPFRIIPWRTSRTLHPDEATDSPRLEDLDLDYLVKGMARLQGETLHIALQLINVPQNRLVWAEKYRGGIDEILDIQEQIVESLVSSLQRFVDDDLLQEIRKKPLTSLSAYECWLRGYRELLAGTPDTGERARVYFRQALALEPAYARAHTGMSLSYFNEWSCQLWTRWEVTRNGAFTWARKAQDLDPHDHVSNAILGRIYLFSGEYEKAEHFLRSSLRINPNDSETVLMAAFGFIYLGLTDEAQSLCDRARELNPSDRLLTASVEAFLHFERGEPDQALALWELRERGRGWVDTSAFMAACHFLNGDLDRMRKCWQDYLDEFSEKINGGTPADTRTALQWMMDVNPYRSETRLKPFWKYMGRTETDDLRPPPGRNAPLSTAVPLHNTAAPLTAGSLPAIAPQQGRFLRDGDSWIAAFGGMEVRIPDLKGCADIARLLSRPHEGMHCTDLMGARALESGAEIIDDAARASYRKRIRELQEEIEEADAMSDNNRLPVLREEYERLVDHLASSVGIGGRTRTVAGTVEKCRSAVTWRIRSAMKKIATLHPSLGRHLEASIRTGMFCTYAPEKDIDWEL